MAVRQAPEPAIGVERQREALGWIDAEVRLRREERLRDSVVLLGLEGARRIDQPTTRPDHGRGGAEYVRLASARQGEVGGLSSPLHFGVASQDAEVRARRVDEHPVARAAELRRERFDRTVACVDDRDAEPRGRLADPRRSEEHTSELQSRLHLVCRLLLEKKKKERPHLIALSSIIPPPLRAQ